MNILALSGTRLLGRRIVQEPDATRADAAAAAHAALAWCADGVRVPAPAAGAGAVLIRNRGPGMRVWALVLGTAIAVCGCANVAPQAPTAARGAAEQRAALPEALVVERQWLQSWFQGTPVLITQSPTGAVTVEVPREFCFEPGRTRLKPALLAVLDKVAQSLRRQPLARLSLLAAPDDATGASTLAVQRAAELHKHLLSRAVPAASLARPTATTAAAVQLRMDATPP